MAISKNELKKLFNRDSYEVTIFKENGYERRKCKVCGDYFWTIEETDICGDTKCVGGYKFIGQTLNGEWDFNEAINRWCGFFERHGHTRIVEYPVVSRWRSDMYFTIASIADFQPWVLNGTIPPPANPLVVPQPCIRFNDTDNIGRSGRHLSCFTMGGQHSFNSEKQNLKGYWMDGCMELNFKFLTEELRLKPKEISYREDIWAGGGNFGPCIEAFARGLEIVNNVFMQYVILPDGSYEEMEMQVIDVGWGLERVAWFSQGTPTVYEATFGPVLDYMKKQTL